MKSTVKHPILVQEEEEAFVDPLLRRISNRREDEKPKGDDEEEDDLDPLVAQGGKRTSATAAAQKPSSSALPRHETFETLMEKAKLGRFSVARSRKLALRARLAALREDLEEDETAVASKTRNSKTRIWVLEQLSRDVQLWWDKGDRSRALRAACLLAGALSDVQDPLEYSREWILATTALNKLNELLSGHLESLRQEEPDEASKWNWYYKICGIRGLVVRLYLQAATWSLLGIVEVEEGARLFAQAQGISHPIVYQYFCAYLSSKGLVRDLQSLTRDTLQSSKYAFLAFASASSSSANSSINVSSEMMVLPLSLTLSKTITSLQKEEKEFGRLLGYCRSPAALHALMNVCDPETIGKHALQILETIELFHSTLRPFAISVLADKLLICDPPLEEGAAKAVMNAAWLILKSTDEALAEQQQQEPVLDVLNAAVSCSAKFLELCANRYGAKEIAALTRELERRVREAGGSSRYNPSIIKACSAICSRVEKDPANFAGLVSGEGFCRLFESLASSYDASSFAQSSSPKTDLAKRLLELFLMQNSKIEFSSAADWAKALNDSLHVLTFDDERRQVSEYLRRFVVKTLTTVAPTLHDEARFALLADLRGRFFNSEAIIKLLIGAAGTLARHARIKREICSACLAFCHATIPSLTDPVDRGLYYAQTAVLAASLGRLPQCDGLFKASVQCVGDACSLADEDKLKETRALELVRTVASSLVVAPGHPHPFYLVRGFVNAVLKKQQWTTGGDALLAVLSLIEVLLRLRLPYRVAGADSNDVLFGDDAATYSNDALALATLVESKLTGSYPGSQPHCASLMNHIRKNVLLRSAQVQHRQ